MVSVHHPVDRTRSVKTSPSAINPRSRQPCFGPIDEHNDVVGGQVSVIGVTHAVIVGFMHYEVWNLEAVHANVVACSGCPLW